MNKEIINNYKKIFFAQIAPIILIVAVCASMYIPTFAFPFQWDDSMLLKTSVYAANPNNITKAFTKHYLELISANEEQTPYYRPFSLSFLLLEKYCFGKNPLGYRIVHSILHLLAALLIFFTVKFILQNNKKTAKKHVIFAATFSSILFLTLPYTVDSVLFLTNLGDLLVLIFILLCMFSFEKYLKNKCKESIVFIFLFSLFAIASKETGIAICVLVPAVYLLKPTSPHLKSIWPGIVTPLISAFIYLVARFSIIEKNIHFDLVKTILRFPYDFATALRWSLAPHPLALEETVKHELFGLWWWLACGALLIFITLFIYCIKRQPIIAMSLIAWLMLIGPSLIALQHTGIFAPRYLYVPSVGLVLAFGYLFMRSKTLVKFGFFAMLVSLLLLSIIRLHSWSNKISFWQLELTRHPNHISSIINYGVSLEEANHPKEALAVYLKAIEQSNIQKKIKFVGLANYNAGKMYNKHFNKPELALEYYKKAALNYQTAGMWLATGKIHAKDGNWKKALAAFEKAKQMEPGNYKAHSFIAGALAALNRFDEAIDHIGKAQKMITGSPQKVKEFENKIQVINKYKKQFLKQNK